MKKKEKEKVAQVALGTAPKPFYVMVCEIGGRYGPEFIDKRTKRFATAMGQLAYVEELQESQLVPSSEDEEELGCGGLEIIMGCSLDEEFSPALNI